MREITVSRRSTGGTVNAISGRAIACWFSNQGEFLFANFAIPVMAAKAAAAMLRGPKGCDISCDGLGHAQKVEEGYSATVTRLPKYATCQVIVVAKRPNLMLGEMSEAVWRYVTSPAITTPVLPEWKDYIARELVEIGKVWIPNGFGYPVYEAKFETGHVDQIVSQGLKRKKLRI